MDIPISNSWPETLPLPFLNYEGESRNATLFSTIESVTPERRSIRSKAFDSIIVQWHLSTVQYAAFRTFFVSSLNIGTSQFSIDLRYPKNSELAAWIVRFVGGFNAQWINGKFVISAKLDLFNTLAVEEPA